MGRQVENCLIGTPRPRIRKAVVRPVTAETMYRVDKCMNGQVANVKL
jgi:hypothetical protein